jgi:hypothetical protein
MRKRLAHQQVRDHVNNAGAFSLDDSVARAKRDKGI